MVLDPLVTATDLDRWANLQEARYRLPLLVRRLVHGTIEDIHRIGFPAGEGVQLGGWDGVVAVESGNAFVPEGSSVWELGANRNVRSKADEDYEKRRNNPLGIDPTVTTFVFVTPRRWGAKEDWVLERQKEGFWREVRVYDADDLEQWLELAPAVHIWLSILLGKPPESADDLASNWADWSEATWPVLSPNLLTTGREEAVNRIHKWLSEAPSALALKADTREEAVAFLAATFHQLSVEERLPYLSRTVVVREGDAWNYLCASQSALLLVAAFDVGNAVRRAVRSGHHALIPLGRDDSDSEATLNLSRLRVRHAREALRGMGLSEKRAGELAALARRSLLALRRKLATNPEVQQPAWAKPQVARALLPALLAGRWDDTKDGDRDAISRLSGTTYGEVNAELTRWANEADPPVRRVGDTWLLVSKEDAWTLLARYLTRDDLERLEAVLLDVLGEIDPSFDLPTEQRPMAGLFGKSPLYSEHLRDGLADTVAIMGARSDTTQWSITTSAQERTNRIVRRLLTRANDDWRLWASLSSLLELLAEAAPVEFLRAVETALSGTRPVLVNLFEDSEGDIFARSSHTGLLWALELLAWHPAYLARTVLLVAKLARLDLGGRLSKRPDDTLRCTFLCWHPQTTADLDQRLGVLDMLRNREPAVAWQLMRRLLPDHRRFTTPTATPRWRDWVPDAQSVVTYGELWAAEREILTRMLADVHHDGQRWKDLIAHLDDVHKEQHDAIVEHLLAIDATSLSPKDRLVIWSALRALISRHREFSDAAWAMPIEMVDRLQHIVDRLQHIYEQIEPDDPIDRNAWLFSHRPKLIGPFGDDCRARDQALVTARQEVVQALYERGGLPLLLTFADQVEQPGELGFALGRSTFAIEEEDTLLGQHLSAAHPPHNLLARGFVEGRFRSGNWVWVENKIAGVITQGWPPEQQAEFFRSLPFAGRTWDLLDTLSAETQKAYWLRVRPPWVDARDCGRAVTRLLKHNRPHLALDYIARHLNDAEANFSASLLAETLERATRTTPERQQDWEPFVGDAGKILDTIEASGEIEEPRIAHLEFALLPFLRHGHRGPKILHKELSRNPDFFVEVLSLVYRADNEEQAELSEIGAMRARLALDLLHTWRRTPGTRDDGSINPEALKEWVRQAREAARANGRGDIGDHIIGEVLTAAPKDGDGSWPTASVRDVIEQAGSEHLDRGFVQGVYNSRGIVTKAIAEGGVQERQLSESYQGYAAMVRDQWPRTAAVLQEIAEIYNSEARRSDLAAELEEDLWQ